MMDDRMLPEGFAALEPFAAGWALSGSAARANRRGASTDEERAAFYAAAKDMVRPALDYLDTRPLDALEEADQRLMDMMLAFAHVSLAVEMQGAAEPVHAGLRAFMPVTHTPAGA